MVRVRLYIGLRRLLFKHMLLMSAFYGMQYSVTLSFTSYIQFKYFAQVGAYGQQSRKIHILFAVNPGVDF